MPDRCSEDSLNSDWVPEDANIFNDFVRLAKMTPISFSGKTLVVFSKTKAVS